MATDVQELYASTVRPLPARERLRLAALILDELTRPHPAPDVSDEWSEQDLQDLTSFALAHHAGTHSEKDDDLL